MLKDWKKDINKKEYIVFHNKENIDTIIIVKDNSSYYYVSTEKKKWVVTSNLGSDFPTNAFKSKSQALKFAKSYMRKN